MREITYREALTEALREEMRRDPTVFLMGEEVGRMGNVFGVTKGLLEEFGEERLRDTPISETAIAGGAVGAALTGSRPVAEIMFADFLNVCMDEIAKAAKWRYAYGGAFKVPLVIRSCAGHVPYGGGPDQSETPEARFLNMPGLKVIVPTTPEDAKGLLKSAIRDDNPVIFLEHKQLYVTKGPVPEGEYLTPIGKAALRRPGTHLTVVASGLMVLRSVAAAAEVARDGIEAEVIDLRTIKPLDAATVIESVRRTSRLLTVEEGYRSAGVGAEVAARVAEEALEYLEAPIRRLAVPDVPIADNGVLSDFVIPTVPRIAQAMRDLVKG